MGAGTGTETVCWNHEPGRLLEQVLLLQCPGMEREWVPAPVPAPAPAPEPAPVPAPVPTPIPAPAAVPGSRARTGVG
jgi:hypothetical protein